MHSMSSPKTPQSVSCPAYCRKLFCEFWTCLAAVQEQRTSQQEKLEPEGSLVSRHGASSFYSFGKSKIVAECQLICDLTLCSGL
mmetsp:Transcript_78574/g.138490  ORF Transcript_78574/g.138490 Transcript_78574/m.138490 type:complete len:84 (-) Transcript_78574:92-343(-)